MNCRVPRIRSRPIAARPGTHLDHARIVTLGIDGKDFAREFLLDLLKHDRNRFDAVQTRIRSISNHPLYENKLTFRHVGEGVFEFKRPGIRLYAFYDELDDRKSRTRRPSGWTWCL